MVMHIGLRLCLGIAREQSPSGVSQAAQRLDPGDRLDVAHRLRGNRQKIVDVPSRICRRPSMKSSPKARSGSRKSASSAARSARRTATRGCGASPTSSVVPVGSTTRNFPPLRDSSGSSATTHRTCRASKSPHPAMPLPGVPMPTLNAIPPDGAQGGVPRPLQPESAGSRLELGRSRLPNVNLVETLPPKRVRLNESRRWPESRRASPDVAFEFRGKAIAMA